MNYQEALRLLEDSIPSDAVYKHCLAVSRASRIIACEIHKRGYPIDIEFVEIAGLLHDIGRCRTHHPSLHGLEGYLILNELGYYELARVSLVHVLKGRSPVEAVAEGMFSDEDLAKLKDDNYSRLTLEEKIVALADTMIRYDLVTIEERVEGLRDKYKDKDGKWPSWIDENEKRALLICSEIEQITGEPVYQILEKRYKEEKL